MTEREVRAGGEARLAGRTLSGVAMPYGTISPDFRERFEPGAFGEVESRLRGLAFPPGPAALRSSPTGARLRPRLRGRLAPFDVPEVGRFPESAPLS